MPQYEHRFMLYYLLTVLALTLFPAESIYANDYKVGVYYFPGWTDTPGAWWNPPWDKIKPYPEREPLLGYYPEKELWVAETHIKWAAQYGVDFFVYDWYWDGRKTTSEHALGNYLKARNRDLVKFCLLWANHSEIPATMDDFERMVDYWVANYFRTKDYVTIDGKPVVFIFSPDHLKNNAWKFKKNPKDMLDQARTIAIRAGFKGIYFIACSQAVEYWVKDHIPNSGYDAISAYNYHRGLSGKHEKGGLAKTYTELAAGYAQSWKWILDNSKLPYILPVTSGWSAKPWGSKKDHDECISIPASFREHIVNAKKMLDLHPDKTKKMIVICCWNEFGEGSYVEPTQKWGFQYLEQVKDILKSVNDDNY